MRPALIISRDNDRRADVVLALITSKSRTTVGRDALELAPTTSNGLKAHSVVRFDKLVTLEKHVIVGQIGTAAAEFLNAARPIFFGVFGFGVP